MVEKIVGLALAGALGTLARYSLAGFVHRLNTTAFPWGTLTVNLSGCFLAGATVLRGFLGFGANSRIHTTKVLRISMDLPLVVEIVDEEDKIKSFLPVLDNMIGEGLVTLEKVKVITYRHGGTE